LTVSEVCQSRGGQPIFLIVCALLSLVVPIVGLNGDWLLYLLGTVGIMVEAEDLVALAKPA
jgi:hypothetical protein